MIDRVRGTEFVKQDPTLTAVYKSAFSQCFTLRSLNHLIFHRLSNKLRQLALKVEIFLLLILQQ